MAKIFISYSTHDQIKAEQICAALEKAGQPCWIAHRNLSAGTRWGAGIVEAVKDCDATVVVLSQAANSSPQVVREMELAVGSHRPLITVRIEDVLPTGDMQYFLGVSHWFDAFAKPLESYLPEIVATVGSVVARERSPWANFTRRMPHSRNTQILLSLAAAALVAILVGVLLRAPNPLKAMSSPIGGRWQAKIPNGGGSSNCVMDVPKSGTSVMASFSDGCPDPLTSASGLMTATKDSALAPGFYKPGDTGTFMFQASGGYFSGAFRIGFFGGLTTRDARLGEVSWTRASDDTPLPNAAGAILSPSAAWPLEGAPAVVASAEDFIRSHWAKDAVLMSLNLKPGTSGGVQAIFTFYSPSNQQGRFFIPNMSGAGLMPPYGQSEDSNHAIAGQFLDLPEAIARARQAGMQGKDVAEAQLGWTGGGSCGTGNFRIDNAILPKCAPHRFVGVQWDIQSASGGRYYVPAAH
jgi:hypothetical protein